MSFAAQNDSNFRKEKSSARGNGVPSKEDVDNLLEMPVDPLCSSLKERSASEIENLANNIESVGQLSPIIKVDGKIFDGRHRLKAIKKLKDAGKHNGQVDCLEYDLSSRDDAMRRVAGDTLMGRHMNTREKVEWAVRYKNSIKDPNGKTLSDQELANLFGIGVRSIELERAKQKKRSPAKAEEESLSPEEMRKLLKKLFSYLQDFIDSSTDEELQALFKKLESMIRRMQKSTDDAESVHKVPNEPAPTKGSKRNRKANERPPGQVPADKPQSDKDNSQSVEIPPVAKRPRGRPKKNPNLDKS